MYTLMHLDGDEICAIYDLDEERREQGVPSHWLSYVSVEERRHYRLEGAASWAARVFVRAARGPTRMARMAVVEPILPARSLSGLAAGDVGHGAGRVNDVGCMGWNELQTRDSGAAGGLLRRAVRVGDRIHRGRWGMWSTPLLRTLATRTAASCR